MGSPVESMHSDAIPGPKSELSEQEALKHKAIALVAGGFTSKEVSQETGLSPHTIDGYMRAAIRRFGVSSRREAARLYLSEAPPQRLSTSTTSLAQTTYDASSEVDPPGTVGSQWWRPPPLGGRDNGLSWGEKTVAILRIGALGTAVITAIAAVIAGALHTF